MLGNKRYSNNNFGNKNYGTSNHGNKNYSEFTKSNSVGYHSPDGVIHNYGNSSEAHREPIKGVQINPTTKRTGMILEKPRKQTESKQNNYV